MKHLTAILGLTILLYTKHVAADGLWIENGKLMQDHTVITLTEGQAEEIDVLDTLTLTSDQWAMLRAKYPACPKRFSTIYHIDHNDCTCGVAEIAVRLSKDKAAILERDIDAGTLKELEDQFKTQRTIIGSRWFEFSTKQVAIRIDERGQCYINGTLLPFPTLLRMVSYPPVEPREVLQPIHVVGLSVAKHKEPEQPRTLSIPVATGVDPELPSVRDRGSKLVEAAKAAGWEISSMYPETSWSPTNTPTPAQGQ